MSKISHDPNPIVLRQFSLRMIEAMDLIGGRRNVDYDEIHGHTLNALVNRKIAFVDMRNKPQLTEAGRAMRRQIKRMWK